MGNGVLTIGWFADIFKSMLDMIYPEKMNCIFCRAPLQRYNDYQLCGLCMSLLPFLSGDTCSKCGKPLDRGSSHGICSDCADIDVYFDGAASVFEYAGIIQSAIYRLKYDGDRDIASVLGKFMARELDQRNWRPDVIIPVPLHLDRLNERGFNQSELLAATIGRESGIDVATGVLTRKKYTESQVSLTRLERRQNVRGVFEADGSRTIKDKSVLVVDDIMTTGATLNECSRALKGLDPASIYCLSAATPSYVK